MLVLLRCIRIKRNTVTCSDNLTKNESKLLNNTVNNTVHSPKKGAARKNNFPLTDLSGK
jgi:hypothetical protein